MGKVMEVSLVRLAQELVGGRQCPQSALCGASGFYLFFAALRRAHRAMRLWNEVVLLLAVEWVEGDLEDLE